MPEQVETIFLALFGVYIAETLWTQARHGAEKRRKLNALRVAVQVPLFVLGAYLAVKSGALDRRLVSLVEIIPGLVAGHVIFVASVLATHSSMRDAWEIFKDWESLRDFFVNNPHLTFRTIQISFTEEVIYRAVLQGLLAAWWGPVPAILFAAAVFTISHEHVFRNSWRETAEFVAFSLLLGGVYYATSSLAAVVAIHVVRNFEIASLEFSARAHELDSEEEAQVELDQRYRQESVTPS
jgi:membrane protease YdiL (CAAX protease family)